MVTKNNVIGKYLVSTRDQYKGYTSLSDASSYRKKITDKVILDSILQEDHRTTMLNEQADTCKSFALRYIRNGDERAAASCFSEARKCYEDIARNLKSFYCNSSRTPIENSFIVRHFLDLEGKAREDVKEIKREEKIARHKVARDKLLEKEPEGLAKNWKRLYINFIRRRK